MEHFSKIVTAFQLLIMLTKNSILSVLQCFEYASTVYWPESLKSFCCEVGSWKRRSLGKIQFKNEVREPDVSLQRESYDEFENYFLH